MNGFNEHRHKTNPKEKEIHDKFKNEFVKPRHSANTIDRLVFGHSHNSITPNDFLSDREKQIVLSAMQWLGSPVGQGFLKSCGFTADNNR